jgi:hypothetical protein
MRSELRLLPNQSLTRALPDRPPSAPDTAYDGERKRQYGGSQSRCVALRLLFLPSRTCRGSYYNLDVALPVHRKNEMPCGSMVAIAALTVLAVATCRSCRSTRCTYLAPPGAPARAFAPNDLLRDRQSDALHGAEARRRR